jgi:endonuclease-3
MRSSDPTPVQSHRTPTQTDELQLAEAIHPVVEALAEAAREWRVPVVTEMAKARRDPFRVLIACVLSSRTKDDVTAEAVSRLFAAADEPEGMAALGQERIAELIYPVGFYRTKARHIVATCRDLSSKWEGRVPDEMDELLTLSGVGRKTANLVLTQGFGKPGICVDTHVHRIANRLGYVRTAKPEDTEFALREKLPPEHWIVINDLLVAFGQHLCTPISPHCSTCPVSDHCWRVGVGRSR